MNRSPTYCAAAGLAAMLITACGSGSLSGPPELHVGRDECAGCGMLISEDRCACALLVDDAGERSHLVFDDLGCLLDYRAAHPEQQVVEVFVRDYAARNWVRGAEACFLAPDPAVHTPMGSGLIAFATAQAAQAQRSNSGVAIVRYDGLDRARQEWRRAREAAGR